MGALAAVAAGGFLGGLARYGLALLLPAVWSTVVVNVVGAFLLGLVLVLLLHPTAERPHLRAFLATGVLGSFTTFSTWMLEVEILLSERAFAVAALHLLGSLTAGLAAAGAGLTVGRALARLVPARAAPEGRR